MRILVMGYHNIGCRCLEYLVEMGENVVGVVTHQDNPKENIWFDSVYEVACRYNIPVFTPEDPNTIDFIQTIEALNPSLLFSFYYRKMLKEPILKIPPMGCINFHGSLLPKYRGRCPVNWVLLNGEEETGVTLHYMVIKPDAGGIIAQRRVPITEVDTALTLYQKMTDAAVTLLRETWPMIKNGTAPRIPQDDSQESYFGGRKPEDGRITWAKSSKDIYNLVRAVTHPYPGTFTIYRGSPLYVWASALAASLQSNQNVSPGTVLAIDYSEGIVVKTGDGTLALTSVQWHQGQEYSGPTIAERIGIKIGDQLGE